MTTFGAITTPTEMYAAIKAAGGHLSLANTYISGTGTAGADNTAQAVKSITVPANILTQVGDRLRVRIYVYATAGAPITATLTLNGVSLADVSLINTDVAIEEAWMHYIDNTHANILDSKGAPGFTAMNVAGFDWSSAQTCSVSQSAVAAQHIVVGVMIADLFPKGLL